MDNGHDVTSYSNAPSKFRFKSKRSRSQDEVDGRLDGSRSVNGSSKTARSAGAPREGRRDDGTRLTSRRHHGQKKRHSSANLDDRSGSSQPHEPPQMDAETAFREALFDAMADDEGAAYWQGVYDQPIHIYPNTKVGPEGHLEQMSDEEYTAFVRAKMYEKTHEHIVEERKQRGEARRRQSEQRRQAEFVENEHNAFQSRMEESLRRGEERRAARQWKEVWAAYMEAWDRLHTLAETPKGANDRTDAFQPQSIIPWPVKSRKMENVGKEEIERFFRHAPVETASDHKWLGLKAERVRWHPDKMQQRFGSERMDSATLQAVTAVFQVVDMLYADSNKS